MACISYPKDCVHVTMYRGNSGKFRKPDNNRANLERPSKQGTAIHPNRDPHHGSTTSPVTLLKRIRYRLPCASEHRRDPSTHKCRNTRDVVAHEHGCSCYIYIWLPDQASRLQSRALRLTWTWPKLDSDKGAFLYSVMLPQASHGAACKGTERPAIHSERMCRYI